MPNKKEINDGSNKSPEIEVTPYSPTNSFRIDGLEFNTTEGDKKTIIPTIKDEQIAEKRNKLNRTYNVAGDFIYVTGESGEVFVVANTQSELRKLYEAGYKYSNEITYYLEDRQPITLKSRIEFLEFKLKAIEQRKKESIDLHLSIYAEQAEKRGLREIVDGYFIKIDGIEYLNFIRGTDTEKIPLNTDGNDFRLDRLRTIGYYDSNNGKLCYVGSDGCLYIGANSSDNIKALTKAGYRPGNLFVPFSNGETPINDEMKQLLNDVCSGKKPEELRAERLAKVVNFSSTNKRLFGTFPKTPNVELMRIYSDPLVEEEFDTVNKTERQRLVEAIRTETDQFGRTLKIYLINGREIVFRGREELPEIETVNSGNTLLVGERPVKLPDIFFKPFEKKATSNQVSGEETILAVKNLRGVLETAVILGLQDEKILQLLEEIKMGVYSDRAIEMVDALVALNFYRPEFGDLNGEMETDSEIIFLQALLGNDEAQKYVTRRLIEYQAYSESLEEKRKESFREFYGKNNNEALNIQDLCIVHATKYEPRKDGEGLYSIPTTFDATNGEYLRNSVHLTLNHRVHSHWEGNWDQTGYTIISPLSDTLAVNGDPEAVNFEDTWFLMNPGQRFNFRRATVIAFSSETDGEIIQFDEKLDTGMVRLKPVGYNARDLRTLMSMETLSHDRTTEIFTDMIIEYISKLESERGNRNEEAHKKALEERRRKGEVSDSEYLVERRKIEYAKVDRDSSEAQQYNYSYIFEFNSDDYKFERELSDAVKKSLETSQGESMEETAKGIIRDTRLAERIRSDVRRESSFDVEDTILSLIKYMAEEGEKRVATLLNRIATEQALERRGFKVARIASENNLSLDSGFRGSLYGLNAQLGSKVGLHNGTPEDLLLQSSDLAVLKTFIKIPHDSDKALLPNLRAMRKSTYSIAEGGPSLRRMLYVSGITPSYTGK